jgi:hypothetical protein
MQVNAHNQPLLRERDYLLPASRAELRLSVYWFEVEHESGQRPAADEHIDRQQRVRLSWDEAEERFFGHALSLQHPKDTVHMSSSAQNGLFFSVYSSNRNDQLCRMQLLTCYVSPAQLRQIGNSGSLKLEMESSNVPNKHRTPLILQLKEENSKWRVESVTVLMSAEVFDTTMAYLCEQREK